MMKTRMKNTGSGILSYKRVIPILFILLFSLSAGAAINKVKIYSCPDNKMLSNAYSVTAAGKPVPVYLVKVGAADNVRRFKAVDDLMHSADYYDTAAFAYFDMQGSAVVTVTIDKEITAAKILPASAGIKPLIRHHSISFKVSSPQNLTVEINGEWVKSLHIFVNPIETNVPKPTDPNVIYFGPGIHEISSILVGNNKTIYIAGGAVVRAVIGKDEKYGIEPSGLRNYTPSATIELIGRNIKFRGRGIMDATACPTHARSFITISGSNIHAEGVILLNTPGWTVPVRSSDSVTLTNLKLIGYRANSDGIDICNSRNVTVEKCFIRTNDDLIVVKTWEHQGNVNGVVVKKCVLFNQLAHALSLGAELRENVNDVLFTDCDIIHDQGREWSLRVFHSDASLITNIRFENIRIEESHQFISLFIGKIGGASFDKELGSIEHIVFKNITATGSPLSVQVIGGSDQHLVKDVLFKNVLLNGKPLTREMMQLNPFIKNLNIEP